MMKKIFTTILTLLPGLACGTTADSIKVTVNGRVDSQFGVVKQNPALRHAFDAQGKKFNLRSDAVVTDAVIELRADGKYSQDLKYGTYLTFHGDPSEATNGEDTFGDKAMLYIQHEKIGRLEIGNSPSAAGLFEMDTVNLGRGSYGIEGFWSQWVVQRTHRTTEVLGAYSLALAVLSSLYRLTYFPTTQDTIILMHRR
jgi:hypothetical protein